MESKPKRDKTEEPQESQEPTTAPTAAEDTQEVTPKLAVPSGESPTLPMVVPKPRKQIGVSFGRIALISIVFIAILAGALYLWHRHEYHPAVMSQKKPTSSVTPAPAKPKTPQPLALTTTDATYLDTAKLLGDQKIFADTSSLGQVCNTDGCRSATASDILYYQIGTASDGSEVLYATTPSCGPGGCFEAFALEKGGEYRILLATAVDSSTDISSEAQQYAHTFTSNVTLDTTTKLAGLDFPATLTINGQVYNRRYSENYGSFMQHGLSDIRGQLGGSTTAQPVKLGETGNDTFYKLVTKDDTTFQVVEDYATFGNLFTMPYDLPNPLQTSAGKPVDVTWQTGSASQVSLAFPPTSACGAEGYTSVKVADASQLTAVGTSTQGQTLYQLPADNAFSQKVYTEDYANGASAEATSLQNLTQQQFMNDHGYELFKDGLGEYVMLVRDDMITGGGCAKPVIYLYPQQPTDVSVRVDASVVKSDPLYPAPGGWQNVLAEPSGALSYQGKTYGSLYWEGKGFGAYPDITSGTVVKSAQAVATIQSQLKAQGLNSTEISDFLAYWQPKLPATPYVRLTWLDTAQMNVLAPLNISPRPQTLIRVFLDFEGLQQPEKLPAQQFAAPARQGFTVVEWGGLARNGLQ